MAVSREYHYASFCAEKGAASVFPNKRSQISEILEDENFILHIVYLSHIFGVMNHFSCSLQGPESNIIDFSIKRSKIKRFTKKLDLCIKNNENRQFGMFENVASLTGEPIIAFGQKIIKHLLLLKNEIKQYFFNDGEVMHKHALTIGIHSLSRLAISQWELENKNS